MNLKHFGVLVVLASTLAAGAALACDYTAVPGQNLQGLLNSTTVTTLCLSPGTYNLTSTLVVPAGKQLEGTGSTRDLVRIVSSAETILRPSNHTTLKNFAIEGAAGTLPVYGVLSYYENEQIIWGLRIKRTLISIGLNGSTNAHVWDTFMSENGNLSNGSADPNLWITDATNVEILWGEARGRANGPGGDGEIAGYNSQGVKIYGTYVVNSGASAIYLVNCDNCAVENATVTNAGEWGLDIVSGSDNFLAKNNYVAYSRWGGSVYNEKGSVGGQYIGNQFVSNNTSGYGLYCNGINTDSIGTGFVNSGNTVNSGQLVCRPWP
ncbi:right-handed parallel beta-helix repeat-containing protein [Vitiosangium sp. GDMCC 1.1324]|uniref:right-handed parallel beta-helix repeat-containing protein n=1 Tax=Vitiosangium sp. (strain GDMCC 1.1324) TaxID=2138576 RepID=UPI000D3D369B|nr:right-handed parallel beta-helix repeat-containing protein [Vitiosangium sp. GDMCC 1.1324]PTL77476.1 hypothetical protein DAT35_44555 [Vitiosangium sp. GDMCC 1.1324]